jgi:hypothetical protein
VIARAAPHLRRRQKKAAYKAAIPTSNTREGLGECSCRTKVRFSPPRLDRCHETRTKQTLARSQQWGQPAP